MKPIFIDSSYLIALEAADDQNHKKALLHWQELIMNLPMIVTTSYILNEVATFFNSRNNHDKAVEIGNNILNSSLVKFIHIDEPLFHDGWLYFRRHKDKSYSLTDCISFIVMNQHGIKTALTFDAHFIQAGFKTHPAIN
ncbi:MAG: PIN domain-containing protein [Nitrospirae bacterium]|nr:PIN domain-containing protein [Nitrospirota bacterium]